MNNGVSIPVGLVNDINLSSRARFVYIVMTAIQPCDRNIDMVAQVAGLNRSTVYKHLKELLASGWVSRSIVRENGRIKRVDYVLNDGRTKKR